VPGYQAPTRAIRMAAEAKKIGFPVMIKAVAGAADAACGWCWTPGLSGCLAQRAIGSQGAFGDGTVILERAIVDPRHIGNPGVWRRLASRSMLGERDCSVQRPTKKLIEEGPSPAVTPELRRGWVRSRSRR